MRISESTLRKIISEETHRLLREQDQSENPTSSPDKVVEAGFEKYKTQLDHVIKSVRAFDPNFRGTWKINFTVLPDGRVSRDFVTVTPVRQSMMSPAPVSSPVSKQFVTMAVTRIKGWRFPAIGAEVPFERTMSLPTNEE